MTCNLQGGWGVNQKGNRTIILTCKNDVYKGLVLKKGLAKAAKPVAAS